MLPKEEKFDHHTFISPFTWRYGSKEMRKIFSEIHTRTYWRKIWSSLAEAQSSYGLVSKEEVKDLKSKTDLQITVKDIELNPQFDMDIFIPRDQ